MFHPINFNDARTSFAEGLHDIHSIPSREKFIHSYNWKKITEIALGAMLVIAGIYPCQSAFIQPQTSVQKEDLSQHNLTDFSYKYVNLTQQEVVLKKL